MSQITPLGYLAIFGGAALLTLVLVPLALRTAVRRQILDHPGEHKHQANPVPYLGGVAIVVAFAASVLIAALVRPPVAGLDRLVVILVAAVAVSLVGLADDLRGLGPTSRLVAVSVAALALFLSGVRVHLFEPEVLDLLVTIVWVVGITNAFNLLDNMDGLSAGVAAIAAAWFFVIATIQGQFLVAALSLALAGCALGFLRHNYHPARIYMGDAGSLFLGFLLATLGLVLTVPTAPVVASAVPILVVGVAIFDTTLVTVGRLAHGRSPFQGGRDHVSHRLVALGLPVRAAVATVYAASLVVGAVALVIALPPPPATSYVVIGAVVAVLVVLGVLLARVPVYGARTSLAEGGSQRPQGMTDGAVVRSHGASNRDVDTER